MKIIICDDEEIFAKHLAKLLQFELLKYQNHIELLTLTNSLDAIKYLETQDFDAIFLDINMPDLDGLELAKHIRITKPNAIIVFVTSHDDMVFQSFPHQPLWFVRKSDLEQLPQVVNLIIKKIKERRQAYTLKIDGELLVIQYSDIIYFESRGHYVTLHATDFLKQFKAKLNSLEQKLEITNFVRIHASYLVNCEHIKCIDGYNLTLKNDEVLPISRSHLKETKQKFQRYMREAL